MSVRYIVGKQEMTNILETFSAQGHQSTYYHFVEKNSKSYLTKNLNSCED
jgi:hypothetical protein